MSQSQPEPRSRFVRFTHCRCVHSVIMTVIWDAHYEWASKITRVSIVCSTIHLGADQRKHQTSASMAFVRGIHRWPANSPHKGTVTRKMFLFDDVIMRLEHVHVSNKCLYYLKLLAVLSEWNSCQLQSWMITTIMMTTITFLRWYRI